MNSPDIEKNRPVNSSYFQFQTPDRLFVPTVVRFEVPPDSHFKSQYPAAHIQLDSPYEAGEFIAKWFDLVSLHDRQLLTGATARHTLGVIYFLDKLGEAYHLDDLDGGAINTMKQQALLHDYGKRHPEIQKLISQPRSDFSKEDRETIAFHTEYGAYLLGYGNDRVEYKFGRHVILTALHHHKTYDELIKLQNERQLDVKEVLFLSMLILADSMEAAINPDRDYKEPKKGSALIEDILKGISNGRYNPDLQDSFIDMWITLFHEAELSGNDYFIDAKDPIEREFMNRLINNTENRRGAEDLFRFNQEIPV